MRPIKLSYFVMVLTMSLFIGSQSLMAAGKTSEPIADEGAGSSFGKMFDRIVSSKGSAPSIGGGVECPDNAHMDDSVGSCVCNPCYDPDPDRMACFPRSCGDAVSALPGGNFLSRGTCREDVQPVGTCECPSGTYLFQERDNVFYCETLPRCEPGVRYTTNARGQLGCEGASSSPTFECFGRTPDGNAINVPNPIPSYRCPAGTYLTTTRTPPGLEGTHYGSTPLTCAPYPDQHVASHRR